MYQVAATAWQRALWWPMGADALAYLHRRGLPDEVRRHEGIGFATATLAGELRRHDFDLVVAQGTGLRPDGHETFAGRVVLCEWRHVAARGRPSSPGRVTGQGKSSPDMHIRLWGHRAPARAADVSVVYWTMMVIGALS